MYAGSHARAVNMTADHDSLDSIAHPERRPLVLGLRRSANGGGDEWCVASEDCAFGPIGFKRVRDVAPGEMIVIDPEGRLHSRQCVPGQVRRHHLEGFRARARIEVIEGVVLAR